MRSSGTISLFSERPQSSAPSASFFLSIVAHGVAIAAVAAGFMLTPHFRDRVITERYSVRRLDLHLPELPPIKRQNEAAIPYPTPEPDRPSPQKSAAQAPSPAREVAELKPAPQTLMQPKLPHQMLAEKIPVPTVVIWQLETKPNTVIVAPLPQKTAPALIHPSVEMPNEETDLADVAIASADLASKTQPILATNTTPVPVTGPKDQPSAPPQTTSQSDAQPTPAAIVSLSDLRANGPVVLPPVNQAGSGNSSGSLQPGESQNQGQSQNQGKAGANTPGMSQTSTQGVSTAAAATPSNALSASLSDPHSVERIMLPKDGQFGAVIVGSSLEETYPEASEIWGGRLAYTVYLHVGLRKSWILQYSLPASAMAAAGGNAVHIAAPWPYTIIRPNLSGVDVNADALMIHGIVDQLGKFQAIAVAFPPGFAQAQFLVGALKQWEFRPAAQDGKPIAVEVLLIIPDETQ